jgi:Tfp pilus assembly protein PilZ
MEKRKHPRKDVDLHVTFRPVESPNAGWLNTSRVVNLSRYGVFVKTETRLPVGASVELSIELASSDEPVLVKGEVRWLSEEPGNAGMGVQFYEQAPPVLWEMLSGS